MRSLLLDGNIRAKRGGAPGKTEAPRRVIYLFAAIFGGLFAALYGGFFMFRRIFSAALPHSMGERSAEETV